MIAGDEGSSGRETRRAFLKRSCLLGLGTMSALLLPEENAEAFFFNKKKDYKVTKTRLAMGTFVAMTAIHPSRDQAEEAFELAFEEVSRLSALLSRHDEKSPISSLNRSAILEDTPREVLTVLNQSNYYFRQTGGAFDITVKPLVDLYQARFDSGLQPLESEIDKRLEDVDGASVDILGDTVTFKRENMQVTLDGIAKGFIVDRASEILKTNGVENHLVNAGGDIKTSGVSAQGKKWKIAIQDPNKKGHYPSIIQMDTGAVATSGNYEAYYDQEKLFHHIINPHTGISPQVSASVSITAPTVMEADALATAVFVLEPDSGLDFINVRKENDCFIIDRGGRRQKSAGWRDG